MTREEINSAALGKPVGHYCDAVRTGELLFVSGCMPVDRSHNLIGANDFERQARCAFANMGHVLSAAGFRFTDVAKLTIYLTDFAYVAETSKVRAEIFGDVRPAATVVEIAALALPGMMIEVDAIASQQGDPDSAETQWKRRND